jgi:hypothetical protein
MTDNIITNIDGLKWIKENSEKDQLSVSNTEISLFQKERIITIENISKLLHNQEHEELKQVINH